MPLPLAGAFLLALPLIEIAGFVIVGSQIGVLATIGLVLLSVVVGTVLMRLQGISTLARVRADMDGGRDPSRQLVHGFMVMVAGLLLVIPGFFTDIVGLLLFIPPVRDLAWRYLRRRIVMTSAFGGAAGFRSRREQTIDLDEDDYSRAADPNSPWKRIDRD